MTDPDHQTSPGSDGVPPPVLGTTAARSGVTLHRMRYVLGASLVLVIVLFLVAWWLR